MVITEKDIKKLALLTRIKLTHEEENKFGGQISSILDYVRQIESVDTSSVKGGHFIKNLRNVSRPDEKKEFSEVKKIIKQFPVKAGNLNKVKAVLDN